MFFFFFFLFNLQDVLFTFFPPQQSWLFLDNLKSHFTSSDVEVFLTAKTCEIFFYKTIRSKSVAPNAKGDAALDGLLSKLLELKYKVTSSLSFFFILLFLIIFDINSHLTIIFRTFGLLLKIFYNLVFNCSPLNKLFSSTS